jgi:hypothetical protein
MHWKLPDVDSHSDHKYITFEISGQTRPILAKNTFIFDTKKADWAKFGSKIQSIREELELKLDAIDSEPKLNEFVEDFNQILAKICYESIPKISLNNKCKGNKWWTVDLRLCSY